MWEVVAQNFNDLKFVVYSESLPDLHSAFADVMELKFEDMPGGAITPEEAKKKFGDCRAKLIQVCTNFKCKKFRDCILLR